MKSKALLLFFPIFASTMSACLHTDGIPYAITEPECKIGKVQGVYEFAGVHFMFYNNSNKTVQNLKFICAVFDSSGEESPFVGSNIISATHKEPVLASDAREITLSLDQYIHQLPLEPYIIDFFYVTKIEYDDGSVWTDPYGAWMPGGL